jgi:peroxiredoxin
MTVMEPRPPLKPGEPAPDFVLPSGHGEGTVSLAEYRGKSPVLLALFRGLY